MVLYNITVIIQERIQDYWLEWVRSEYVPAIMDTDLFVSNRILKVLDSPNEGATYCIQFIADTLDNYNNYLETESDAIEMKHHVKFENNYVSFKSVMEFIDQ